MEGPLKEIKTKALDGMKKAIAHLEDELLKVRAGKATPGMVDSVRVEYYGSTVPMSQVANINTPDAKTITIQPWEKSMIEPIEKAIAYANLGLNPQNNGEQIIISVPPLTEERRKDLVKKAKAEGEHAKVGIRNARKEANDEIKRLQKDGLSEDEAKVAEADIQKLTDEYNVKADGEVSRKEQDIMTI